MDNENNSAPRPRRSVGLAAVIVAGVFVICMVFFIGRVVFASNAETAPKGLDTATINTNVTEPQVTETTAVTSAPNAAVTVLGYEDNGYVKVTFMSTDGQLTGYIYRDYLSDYQTVLPPWEQ